MLDTIDDQLAELAAVRLPAPDDPSAREALVADLVAARGGRDCYGAWVYLPWEAKVVHLLDRDAYFEVVTSRNQDKITRREQRLLRTKRIGVMGLSVGGEAAVTVAQEHLCGEIVLADFDELDLLLEECDALAMKHRVRRLARERGLNIVYAGDERGFLSIEPYGNEPELAVFHGRIERPQPPREAYPSPQAFMRALAEWLGGWDRISERSRHSLDQIGETLCGYPQLASEARYAAGQLGHVVRRLLLGERLPPFVGHLDLEDLVPGS